MNRSCIIFGNGLGMALDSVYFRLSAGLEDIWHSSDALTSDAKRLIISAIPGASDADAPQSEGQLDELQLALVYSDYLKSLETDDSRWLNENSRVLPNAFRKYIHEVGFYFQNSGKTLPSEFVDALSLYIHSSISHVATLNYDNLLYDSFKATGVLSGYDGPLIDGFHSRGFSAKNLVRFSEKKHAWFLHLHGSPLFVGNKKLMRSDKSFPTASERNHIVLTHVRHKRMLIESSEILSEYWSRLMRSIRESNRIILFGYSGDDAHLNELINNEITSKPLHVIEWSGSGRSVRQQLDWSARFPEANLCYQQLPNILSFTEWSSLE